MKASEDGGFPLYSSCMTLGQSCAALSVVAQCSLQSIRSTTKASFPSVTQYAGSLRDATEGVESHGVKLMQTVAWTTHFHIANSTPELKSVGVTS